MKFYGELLVFLLLLITNLRVFFVNNVRRDPLVALAPFTFILTILQILAWGLDPITFLAFFTGFLVFLSNFHAMFRYSERLYIDHYSPLMKTWAVFTILISLFAIVVTVIFKPVEIRSSKLGVEEKVTRYSGSFQSGFSKSQNFHSANAFLYEFYPATPLGEEKPQEKGIILFVPDKRADTANYKPYLQLLANEGFHVYSADFFSKDLRWMHSFKDNKYVRRTFSVIESISDNQNYMSHREFYTYNFSKECQELLKMIDQNSLENYKFYVVTDETGKEAIEDFKKEFPERVKGSFYLNSVNEYITPGYGFIEQTDPLLASYFDLKRDSSMKTPKLTLKRTLEVIK